MGRKQQRTILVHTAGSRQI